MRLVNPAMGERLRSQIGLQRRQRAREIGNRFSLARVQLRLNVVRQHRARPAVLHGFAGVPEAVGRGV